MIQTLMTAHRSPSCRPCFVFVVISLGFLGMSAAEGDTDYRGVVMTPVQNSAPEGEIRPLIHLTPTLSPIRIAQIKSSPERSVLRIDTDARTTELRMRAEKGDAQAQELLVQILEKQDAQVDPRTGLVKANYAPETLRWKKELAKDDRTDVTREIKSKQQSSLAWHAYRQSAPAYAPSDESCRAAIDYAKSAIANGDKCAGQLLGQIHRLGHCSVKDERESRMWTVLTIGCPTP